MSSENEVNSKTLVSWLSSGHNVRAETLMRCMSELERDEQERDEQEQDEQERDVSDVQLKFILSKKDIKWESPISFFVDNYHAINFLGIFLDEELTCRENYTFKYIPDGFFSGGVFSRVLNILSFMLHNEPDCFVLNDHNLAPEIRTSFTETNTDYRNFSKLVSIVKDIEDMTLLQFVRWLGECDIRAHNINYSHTRPDLILDDLDNVQLKVRVRDWAEMLLTVVFYDKERNLDNVHQYKFRNE